MTDHPYTDGDLIAEATHQHRRLVEAPDRKTVGAELDADWDGGADLTEDERADAVDAVYDLLCDAADVSEWAVRLGAAGLEPDLDRQLTLDAGEKPIVRVLFAFGPRMSAAMRDDLVTGLGKAIDDALGEHRDATRGETVTEWGVRYPDRPEVELVHRDRGHAEAQLRGAHRAGHHDAHLVTRQPGGDWRAAEDGDR